MIYYVRTFWKNVFIGIAGLYASPRRADIINYAPTGVFFLYLTHDKLCLYGWQFADIDKSESANGNAPFALSYLN